MNYRHDACDAIRSMELSERKEPKGDADRIVKGIYDDIASEIHGGRSRRTVGQRHIDGLSTKDLVGLVRDVLS